MLTVFSQVKYIRTKDMGFNTDKVIIIDKVSELGNQQEIFKQKFSAIPEIVSTSLSNNIPGRDFNGQGILREGGQEGEVHILSRFVADYNILETFDIQLIEGRFFALNRPSDSSAMVLPASEKITLNYQKAFISLLKRLKKQHQCHQQDQDQYKKDIHAITNDHGTAFTFRTHALLFVPERNTYSHFVSD